MINKKAIDDEQLKDVSGGIASLDVEPANDTLIIDLDTLSTQNFLNEDTQRTIKE